MKKLLLVCLSFYVLSSSAQNLQESQYINLQALEKQLANAKSDEEKTNALISLFIYHSAHGESFNKKAAKDYEQQTEIFTHQTNDPELIARWMNMSAFRVNGEQLKKRISRLYEYAKLHKLPLYMARAKIRESAYAFNFESDPNKAVQLINEALNFAKEVNDSAKTSIYLQAGGTYNTMNNHLQALQLAFQANEMAVKMHNRDLLVYCNYLFDDIYRNLDDPNKAVEYTLENIKQLTVMEKPHLVALRHARAASYYFLQDQPILGNYHVQQAYRLADSIKGSQRLYNQITGDIVGALSRANQDDVLVEFLKKSRKYFFIMPGSNFLDNVTLARAFAKTGNMDSARSLINKATEYLSENSQPDVLRRYFFTLARIASYDHKWSAAIENYKKALEISLTQNDLSYCIEYTDSLNDILVNQAQFEAAVNNYKLRDSLQKELTRQLNKEDITRQEVAALEKQKEMEAIEKEKEKQQRYNVQYLGITFGVVALFILLLLMGIFKVSPRTIKILSFFSFLLFFEFIFLIFKKQIGVITHGEPWKDLAFMVLLAAVMVPLHHWGEHKVVEYLSTKQFSFFKTKSHRGSAAKKQMVS